MQKYTVDEWITLLKQAMGKESFMMCQIPKDLWENRRINSASHEKKIYKIGVARDPLGKLANVWSFSPTGALPKVGRITKLSRGLSTWFEEVKGIVGQDRFTSHDLPPELQKRGYLAHASRLGLIKEVGLAYHNDGFNRVWVIA